eukprot:scaffold198499_cov36-Tisochrysis_lutea.AAC.2
MEYRRDLGAAHIGASHCLPTCAARRPQAKSARRMPTWSLSRVFPRCSNPWLGPWQGAGARCTERSATLASCSGLIVVSFSIGLRSRCASFRRGLGLFCIGGRPAALGLFARSNRRLAVEVILDCRRIFAGILGHCIIQFIQTDSADVVVLDVGGVDWPQIKREALYDLGRRALASWGLADR